MKNRPRSLSVVIGSLFFLKCLVGFGLTLMIATGCDSKTELSENAKPAHRISLNLAANDGGFAETQTGWQEDNIDKLKPLFDQTRPDQQDLAQDDERLDGETQKAVNSFERIRKSVGSDVLDTLNEIESLVQPNQEKKPTGQNSLLDGHPVGSNMGRVNFNHGTPGPQSTEKLSASERAFRSRIADLLLSEPPAPGPVSSTLPGEQCNQQSAHSMSAAMERSVSQTLKDIQSANRPIQNTNNSDISIGQINKQALRKSAAYLDEFAAHLESLENYAKADSVRASANRLRLSARQIAPAGQGN